MSLPNEGESGLPPPADSEILHADGAPAHAGDADAAPPRRPDSGAPADEERLRLILDAIPVPIAYVDA
ncbi:MAG TPA: hypothetical protein VE360_17660, partial [Pyrinomonadaceae bacterium]|nr:hypothetical protein [Pyrinomonadaceae bacterium]